MLPDGRHPNQTTFPAERREVFLMKLAACGRPREALVGLGVSYQVMHYTRDTDVAFEEACKAAMAVYAESLEKAAHTRAVDGVKEPLFDKEGNQLVDADGNPVFRSKYSDRLLELMLKRHIPEYRERFEHDVNMRGGVLVVGARLEDAEAWIKKHGGKAPEDAPSP